jgi:hypothetical protein
MTFPQVETVGTDLKRNVVERIYARILTSLYFTKNPTMFAHIVTHSETIAIKDNALAALALLRAIITSDWEANIPSDLVSETDPIFTRLQQFPKTGLDVILDPTISAWSEARERGWPTGCAVDGAEEDLRGPVGCTGRRWKQDWYAGSIDCAPLISTQGSA